jgi:putative membrane protein insertion efficiency factor
MMARLLMWLIRVYWVTLSRLIGGQCRFHPTCSRYTYACVERFGALKGAWLGVRRIGRCHPLNPGGVDLPPAGTVTLIALLVLASFVPARATAEDASTATIETDRYIATITADSAAIASFTLKGDRYQVLGKQMNVVTTDKPQYLPASLELSGGKIEPGARWHFEERAGAMVRMSLDLDGTALTRKFEPGRGPYQLWVTTTLRNTGAAKSKLQLHETTHHYVTLKSQESAIPFLPVRSPNISSGLCKHPEDLAREMADDLFEPQSFNGPVTFAGVENVYFLSALAPEEPAAGCTLEASNRGLNAEGEPLGTLYSSRVSHAPA